MKAYLCMRFVKASFFAMVLYKIQIMQAILIFSVYRQRNRGKLDSSVKTIKIFSTVLIKDYFLKLFGSFLILVSIEGDR
jgi:hypothetical protein